MLSMPRLDASGYYALAAPATLLIGAVDHWRCRARGEKGWTLARTISHLSTSMGEVLVGLFAAPFFLALYDWALKNCALIRWPTSAWWTPWVTWTLAFLLGDLCYYINHRAGHRVGLLWAVHNVHHQADEFHLGIALRHPWFADVFAWPFYAPLPLLGIPTEQFFIAISVISYYALSIHSHTFQWHGLWAFVTPRTHQVHHCKNKPYVGNNMGAWLTIWDRIFGTHIEPTEHSEPMHLGSTRGYRTHNGLLAQWLGFRDLFVVAQHCRTWRERAMVVFGPPGYLPTNVQLPVSVFGTAVREDADISLGVRAYCVVHFAIACGVALWLLWLRSQHSMSTQLVVTAWLMSSICTLGMLLDGKPRARIFEATRILLTLVAVCVARVF